MNATNFNSIKIIRIIIITLVIFNANTLFSKSNLSEFTLNTTQPKDTVSKIKKTVIVTENAPKPIGPYSQAIVVSIKGNVIYVSGQIAKDSKTGLLITGDIKSETNKVMENISAILNAAGMDLSHIVKTTIYMKNLDQFTEMNEVYGSFFTTNFPARETVQVAKLPLDVNIEISVIAVK